ncbi:hypothetical protein [Cryobacterium gelidum]|nr:hypothetical protein [Cryobacterium gelidum]
MIALGFGLTLLTLLTSCTADDATEQQAISDSPMVASNFVDPRAGANKWFPLIPGTQWVREGTTLIGNRTVPHKVVTTVTDVIRQIDGVPTVAVYDLSTGAGQVVQKSLDYFAQDKNGAVWTLGGTTEQYEAGRFVAIAEAWLSGLDGAKAGILMPDDPPQRDGSLVNRPAPGGGWRRRRVSENRAEGVRPLRLFRRRARHSRGQAVRAR